MATKIAGRPRKISALGRVLCSRGWHHIVTVIQTEPIFDIQRVCSRCGKEES
jgi:hypothetical protein